MSEKIDLSGWDLIGTIGVDSGQMMVGDPCYLDRWGGHEFTSHGKAPDGAYAPTRSYDYDGACTATCSKDSVGILGNGLAAVSSTGYGDGAYGVYVKRSDEGAWGERIAAMMVVFIGDEDEDEDEVCEECGDTLVGFMGPLCDDCEAAYEDEDDDR